MDESSASKTSVKYMKQRTTRLLKHTAAASMSSAPLFEIRYLAYLASQGRGDLPCRDPFIGWGCLLFGLLLWRARSVTLRSRMREDAPDALHKRKWATPLPRGIRDASWLPAGPD